MNPMTNVRNITKLSERELKHGDGKTSWHDEYNDSAWIFVGGLPFELSEGDVIAVFSQYGEIVNINLIRDKSTGKSKGFGFICYENQKSTVLAVDNFNGIKILGRTVRVDHVKEYKVPKDNEKVDDLTRQLWKEGCAPSTKFGGGGSGDTNNELLESEEDNYVAPHRPALPSTTSRSRQSRGRERESPGRNEKRKHSSSSKDRKRSKKSKKEKKKKKKHKKRSRRDTSSSSDSD